MKFLLDESNALIDAGIFIAAGLQSGDVLVSVFDGKNTWLVADMADRPAIINWQFVEPVTINYERDGQPLSAPLNNN